VGELITARVAKKAQGAKMYLRSAILGGFVKAIVIFVRLMVRNKSNFD